MWETSKRKLISPQWIWAPLLFIQVSVTEPIFLEHDMTNLNNLKISIAGKCSNCGWPLHETFVAQGKHQNIEQRIVIATTKGVLSAVSEATEVKVRDITNPSSRRPDVTLARQLAAWLMRRHLLISYQSIADELGYADHTSVVVAYERFEEHWHYYLHNVLIEPTPFNAMKEWFSDEPGGALMLHVDNLVNDLKVAYGAILRSKIKVKK